MKKGATVYGTESAFGRSGRRTAGRGRRQSRNQVTQREKCVHTGKQMRFLFLIYGKANAGLSPGVCFLDFLLIGSFAPQGRNSPVPPLRKSLFYDKMSRNLKVR